MPGENDNLRSTLEDAYDAADNQQEGGSPAHSPEPVRTSPEAPATGTPTSERQDVDRGDGRTPRGKFARKAGERPVDGAAGDAVPAGDAAQRAAGEAPALKPEGEPAKPDQFAKAPASWKPGAREAWSQLPPDVRAEVHRRERETARIVQETAQVRQVGERIGQMQQQFAPALQAEGVDVLTATHNLMNLASRLRFGSPIEKATLAATIIRNYGVDVNALANVLDGQPPPQGHPPQQMLQDPRVDQLLATLQQAQQQRMAQVTERAVSEVEEFGADKEFFEDVREDMADLLEVAARRGIDLSLEQAYERACKMQPEISKVLDAREAAKRAGNSQQSTQRAKIAASSVRGTPSGVPAANPGDLRGAIEAAIEQVGER